MDNKTTYSNGHNNYENWKLADLETVYRYFPEEKSKEEYITNLISGEIYVAENKTIFQHQSDNNAAYYFGYGNTTFEKNGGNFTHKKDRLATKEEKQWLEACIKATKFIPKEEALKSTSSELTSLPEKWVIFNLLNQDYYRNWKKEKVILPSKEFAENMCKEIGELLEVRHF